MNHKKTIQQIWKRFGVGVLLAFLVLAGCTSPDGLNPLGPGSAGVTAEAENTDVEVLLKSTGNKVKDREQTGPITSTKMIPAKEGGNIVIMVDGAFLYRLRVPPGALDQDTEITMTVPDPSRALVILEPHGLQFNRSVSLDMYILPKAVALLDPNPDNKDPLDIYWYNEKSESWEGQNAEVSINDLNKLIKASAKLNHFSRYSLGGDAALINKMLYQEGWGVDTSYNYYFYSY